MRYNTRNLPLGSLRAPQLFVLVDPAFLPVLFQANCSFSCANSAFLATLLRYACLLCFRCSVILPLYLQVLLFSESLVPTVRKALCDPLEEVREAAAKTFEQLHSTIGHQALEDILPFLLKQLVSIAQHESTTRLMML